MSSTAILVCSNNDIIAVADTAFDGMDMAAVHTLCEFSLPVNQQIQSDLALKVLDVAQK